MKKITEKKERALGTKLFIKADRCNSPKCAMIRHPQRPGAHGAKHHSVSEYGTQLQEKQKLQIIYGLTNKQTSNLFKHKKTKEAIVAKLEKRLDRTVFLLGIAKSPRIARQLVSHGHILVNKRKVTIPSREIKVGDTIEIREESRKNKTFEDLENQLKQSAPPAWLKNDKDIFKGEMTAEPQIDLKSSPFDIDLVGEFYARQ
ncbi:30S ribosomal protein S4 [bacterium]|nr:30S ribosomal protein S4 [bacterium]|tara:strand:- start:874 stop:1479 length:606 start_codon:yes stop_codon:yes gene_type:complete